MFNRPDKSIKSRVKVTFIVYETLYSFFFFSVLFFFLRELVETAVESIGEDLEINEEIYIPVSSPNTPSYGMT